MAEIFTVETRGVGKPDYTREVSRAIQRAGLNLGYEQYLKIFMRVFTSTVPPASPYPHVSAVLAPAASAMLYDAETGLLMTNFILPAGYRFFMISKDWGFSEDAHIWLYMDTALIACPGISPGGDNFYSNVVVTYDSRLIDPNCLLPHTFEARVTNKGAGNLEGGIMIGAVMEKWGSEPLPTTKRVRCPFCEYDKQVVPVETTSTKCERCGKVFIVYSLANYRGTGYRPSVRK